MLFYELQNIGLLKDKNNCSKCENKMNMIKRTLSKKNNHIEKSIVNNNTRLWRCNKCLVTETITKDSIFENCRIPIETFIKIISLWLEERSIEFTCKALNVSRSTTIKTYKLLRNVCVLKMNMSNQTLGGENHIVQVDESLLNKRKFNKGRIVTQKWVIGIIDIVTKDAIIKYIPSRDRETLRRVLIEHIGDESIVHTDCWKGYNNIFADFGQNIEHRTVNHSQNFVDPTDGTHTQNIENLWMMLKNFMRRKHLNNANNMEQYIAEFLWRRKHKNNLEEMKRMILSDIKETHNK